MSKEEYKYKRQAISAAKDLLYPESVLSQLRNAQSEREIERIMRIARKGGM